MKKILLPTDFSANSWNAIKYALNLFKDEECNFHLLNTYTPLIYNIEYMEVSTAQFGLVDAMKETSKNGLEKLQKRIEEEFRNSKHTFTKISSFNTLTNEIKELHEGHAMDFIVMGTKGATGAKEILLGSNTIHVIKNAKCPVLAIPSDFLFEIPHEILFPSDYNIDFQIKHVQSILDIAKIYHSKINILNVSFGYDLASNQVLNKQKLEKYFKKATCVFHSVNHNSVEEAITKFQLNAPVNLLVMINNKHSFFENLFFKSTINHIGFHLNIPFLVIPSKTS
jgi:nucleotide-binding universal stress UspA family protein